MRKCAERRVSGLDEMVGEQSGRAGARNGRIFIKSSPAIAAAGMAGWQMLVRGYNVAALAEHAIRCCRLYSVHRNDVPRATCCMCGSRNTALSLHARKSRHPSSMKRITLLIRGQMIYGIPK